MVEKGIFKIPSHVTHFDDLKDNDFDNINDEELTFDEEVDNLNETLVSCFMGESWKEDDEENEIKDVVTDDMTLKYNIKLEKAKELTKIFLITEFHLLL
ncbi:hypothetical protein R1flu_023518 [Riccia fluitans]|uniref:Uncharacterized protein n=1 Tax=Riccia fluitans TaxID=41844 RepID=A0ABD1XSC0_9MARC